MISTTLLYGLNLAAAALAAPAPLLGLRIRERVAERPRSLDVVTDNVAVLTWTQKESRSSRNLRLLGRDAATGAATMNEMDYGGGMTLSVHITLDGADVPLMLDTGSSDLWIPQANFTCIDEDMKRQPESFCNLGTSRFTGDPSGGWNDGVHAHLTYGGVGVAIGRAGYAEVGMAGIKVPKQQVAIINYTNWGGDGSSCGIIGLGYPDGTHAYTGNDVNGDQIANRVVYDPIFTSVMKQNTTVSSFSIAQPRGSKNAYLALGGLPPVQFDNNFAKSPIKTADLLMPSMAGKYIWYIATVQGFTYDGAPAASTAAGYPALVDTGTSHVYVPTDVYNAVMKKFQPAPSKINGYNGPFVPCTAKVPAFGVTIGGQTFQMSTDTIMEGSPVVVKGTKMCAVSIRDGGKGDATQPYILGQAFLKNVVSVYDIGGAEIRFAALK